MTDQEIIQHAQTSSTSGSQAKRKFQGWTAEENIAYAKFLNKNRQNFRSKTKRKSAKVFKMMALAVGTKSMSQCKSHHQKMLLSSGNIMGIIERFKDSTPFEDRREDQEGEATRSNLESLNEQEGGSEMQGNEPVLVDLTLLQPNSKTFMPQIFFSNYFLQQDIAGLACWGTLL